MDLGERNNGSGPDVAPLFDEAGWALGPMVAWLMTEGRGITEPIRLTDELCQRLVDLGVPLWRMHFSFQILHPQVDTCAFTWTRGLESTEFCVLHGAGKTDTSIGSLVQRADKMGRSVRYRLDRLDPAQDHVELHEWAGEGGTDCVVMPLVFSTGSNNVFIVATDARDGFSDVDVRKFEALVNFLAPVLEVIATRRVARALLDTYVGHRTGNKVLQGLIKRGDGEIIDAALWFSDLRDFTRLTETLPPARLLAMLNTYFEFVATAVTARGGEVLRFIGDAMLIVFPTKCDGDTKAACAAALDAALDIFNKLTALNRQRRQAGEPPISFGVGLHVGEVIYGNVGAPDRLDFTVMGPAVNRTARLESLTKDLGVSLLLSADFAAQVERPVRSLGHYQMKGIEEPQEVFALAYATEMRKTNEHPPNQVDTAATR